MSTNTVTFKVAGNEIFTYLDELKKRGEKVTSGFIQSAKAQADSAKDQLRIVEDQMRALERKNKIEAEAARIKAAQNRDAKIGGYAGERDKEVNRIQQDIAAGKLNKWKGGNAITNAREKFEAKASGANQEFKDELKILREQEHHQGLMGKLLRDNVEAIKSTSNQQLGQMRRNNTDLIDEIGDEEKKKDPKWELANKVAQEKFKEKDEPPSPSVGKQMIGALLNMENLKSLFSSVGTFSNTQNGFDMIAPASKGIGTVVGSILGGLVGTLIEPGGGTIVGSGLGGQIGGMFGDTIGTFEQRRAMGSQDFLSAKNKYEATTQQPLGAFSDMHSMGISASEYLQTLKQIAVNTASTSRSAENTNDVLEMEKALGVDKGVSSQMITYFRGTQKDISNLVKGVMEKGKGGLFSGGDYTFLNEFLQHFNQLHQELRGTQNNVATGTTFDILNTFNRVGGQFSAKDTRSMGLINTIQSALVSPGSDSAQALSFLALRKSNPNMSLADLMEEKQKGLSSPAYLKSMLEMADSLGGSESTKRINTGGLLGLQGNQAAASWLWKNRDKVGTMSTEELENVYSGEFKDQAIGKTTPIDQAMAGIKDGLLSTWTSGVDAMVDAFKVGMENAFKASTITGANGKYSVTPNKVNVTKSNKGGAWNGSVPAFIHHSN